MVDEENKVLLVHENIVGLDDKEMLVAFMPIVFGYAKKHNLLAHLWAEDNESIFKGYKNNWINETHPKQPLLTGLQEENKVEGEDLD